MKNIEELEKKIKIEFGDKSLVKEALTHKSFLSVEPEADNNERLEFLGDAVLELVVTDFLFKKYPSHPEGILTSFRSALVKTSSLAEEAKRMGIGEVLIMSYGEESTGGREREYILANSVEALIGAIYLDQGYKVAREFILENICHKIEKIVSNKSYIDSKSMLQEISQEEEKVTPSYKLMSESGPDHEKIFEMAVFFGEKEIATGKGRSKQEAEQEAAKIALKKLQDEKDN